MISYDVEDHTLLQRASHKSEIRQAALNREIKNLQTNQQTNRQNIHNLKTMQKNLFTLTKIIIFLQIFTIFQLNIDFNTLNNIKDFVITFDYNDYTNSMLYIWEDYWKQVYLYLNHLKNGKSSCEALDELQLTRFCCRRMLIGHVDLTEQVTK